MTASRVALSQAAPNCPTLVSSVGLLSGLVKTMIQHVLAPSAAYRVVAITRDSISFPVILPPLSQLISAPLLGYATWERSRRFFILASVSGSSARADTDDRTNLAGRFVGVVGGLAHRRRPRESIGHSALPASARRSNRAAAMCEQSAPGSPTREPGRSATIRRSGAGSPQLAPEAAGRSEVVETTFVEP
jgi:hypothetical protein